jgi:hypothetical protein
MKCRQHIGVAAKNPGVQRFIEMRRSDFRRRSVIDPIVSAGTFIHAFGKLPAIYTGILATACHHNVIAAGEFRRSAFASVRANNRMTAK